MSDQPASHHAYNDPQDIAFVIGCARSGTSILGELIGSHPGVTYLHEAHHIWKRAGVPADESHRLTAAHALPEVKRRIRKRFWSENEGRDFLVEKNPRSILRVPFIRAVFPEAKLIHIYRDGRDVACSLLPGVGGEDWSHLRPPNWRELFEREDGIIRCAYAWKDSIEVGLADLESEPHLALSYEELVDDAMGQAERIFAYLGLPIDPAVEKFTERISNRTEGSYQPERQKKWFRPDHQVRVGRWRENLSDADADRVQEILAPTLRRLGYE